MLVKKITYNDYDGNELTEEFRFNLSEAEIMEMELSTPGGLASYIERIVAAQDSPTIMKLFKELILKSYGKKSDDGKRFIKNEQISEEFSQTEAYSKLFMELATNADSAAKFISGIIPANMSKELAKQDTNIKSMVNA